MVYAELVDSAIAARCSSLLGDKRETPDAVIRDVDEAIGLRVAPRARAGRLRMMLPGRGEYVAVRSTDG